MSDEVYAAIERLALGLWGPSVIPPRDAPAEQWAALALRVAETVTARPRPEGPGAPPAEAVTALVLRPGTEARPLWQVADESLMVSRALDDTAHAYQGEDDAELIGLARSLLDGTPERAAADGSGPAGFRVCPPVVLSRYGSSDADTDDDTDRRTLETECRSELRDGTDRLRLRRARSALGLILLTRYERTSGPEDLDEAVELLEQAVRFAAPDSLEDTAHGDLARALSLRFVRSGDSSDLGPAIEHAMAASVFDRTGAPVGDRAATWQAVLGNALCMRYDALGAPRDVENAVHAFGESLRRLPAEHPDTPELRSHLGAALLRRHELTGAADDLRASRALLGGTRWASERAAALHAEFLRSGDLEALDGAVADGIAGVGQLPDRRLLPGALHDLAAYCLSRHETLGVRSDAQAAHDLLTVARRLSRAGTPAYALLLVGLGRALLALFPGMGIDSLTSAAELFEEAGGIAGTAPELEAEAVVLLCGTLRRLGRFLDDPPLRGARADALDARLGELANRLRAVAAADAYPSVLLERARLRRVLGDPAGGGELARQALDERLWELLAEPDPGHAHRSARRNLDAACELAAWLLEDGAPDRAFAVVESARALALRAATETVPVARQLGSLGLDGLRARWLRAVEPASRGEAPGGAAVLRAAGSAAPAHAPVPAELRPLVLEALSGAADTDPVVGDFTGTTTQDRTAELCREIGADAVVHLLPGDGERSGWALVLHRAGPVSALRLPSLHVGADALRTFVGAHDHLLRYPRSGPAGWGRALRAVCDWAWTAAMRDLAGHLVPEDGVGRRGVPRVVLVPTGVLGLVPWHAARRKVGLPDGTRGHRYALEDLGISYAPSARALEWFAARTLAPLDGGGLVVMDPLRDLPHARREAADIHRWHYAKGTRLGSSGEPGSSPATPRAVLDALHPGAGGPRPPVAHFACHARTCVPAADSHLLLAGGQRLSAGRLLADGTRATGPGPGSLVVLSACATAVPGARYDEALSLATAFASRGAAAVVGSLWAVGDADTAQLMTEYHHFLNLDGLAPAEALRQAQLRMLERARRRGAGGGPAARTRAEDPARWAAFVHHGRGLPLPGDAARGPGPEDRVAFRPAGPGTQVRQPILGRLPGSGRAEYAWKCPEPGCARETTGDAKAPYDEDCCPDHPHQAFEPVLPRG
ncbi:CHAT domain-containing protein [Streptomyces sp. NBC_01276]|uniref:CHAT domain-containing protein n=1 Tax=Streptomyces sp. NBC_01276 TaxID=2903808 RepID=UPI00352C9E28